MILSPLNYVGNKARILSQILAHFPAQIQGFVDVFAGSGIVGLNAKCQRLVLNDTQKELISLLKYFRTNSLEFILNETQNLIEKFKLTDSKNKPKNFYEIHANEGLSRHNKMGFLALRDSYNKTPNNAKLFVLIIFSFNHFLRFNKNGEFNTPVGKSDFTNFHLQKTKSYINALKSKEITLLGCDFREKCLYEMGEFFYFDPPYLITNAPYNALWSEKDEKDLYEICDFLNAKNLKFAFSNVLESNGRENKMLKSWSKKYRLIFIKRDYKNANYHRKNLGSTKEILITNYGGENGENSKNAGI